MENTKRDFSLDFTRPRHLCQPASNLVTPILTLSTPEISRMITGEELAVLTPNGISSVIPQSNILPSPLMPTAVNSNNIIYYPTSNNNTSQYQSNNKNPPCQSNTNNPQYQSNNNDNVIQRQLDKTRDFDIEKIEKKRERNRLAAKKCRQRKLETIDELTKIVSDWELKYERLEKEFQRFKAIRTREIELLMIENNELKCSMKQ